MAAERATEGVDYYVENGRWVFTGDFLKRRGYCCESGCRHCPYGFRKKTGGTPVPPTRQSKVDDPPGSSRP